MVPGTYFAMMHQISLVNLVTLPLYNVQFTNRSKESLDHFEVLLLHTMYCSMTTFVQDKMVHTGKIGVKIVISVNT